MKLYKRIEALAEARELYEKVTDDMVLGEDDPVIDHATAHFTDRCANEIIPIRDEFREFVEWLKKYKCDCSLCKEAEAAFMHTHCMVEEFAFKALERLGEEKGDD